MDEDRIPSRSEILFTRLLLLLQTSAMQHLGKLPDPLSGKSERDLDQARIAIDTINSIRERTHGNLSAVEERFLNQMLSDLRLNFVDELNRPAQPAEEAPIEPVEREAEEEQNSAGVG